MGEIAEMMLDGTLCEGCGEYLGEGDGFPRYCASCSDDLAHIEALPPRRGVGKEKPNA